ncbi:hypothetical protein WG66_009810 [Moniliophthora roreri]|uniref:GST N-terminal domain-containing protein n=1 Tax=Moniliophthora roreri TaxID=221103 RepID=A0A0W0G5G6_MONRR|nr:hypothetical protein WG66_009810 [Moniliophthora roreri]
MIMLYDLGPTLLQDQSLGVSTHTRKIVLILKYKKIPYEHKFLLFSEIQAAATSVGAPPTATRPDGTPKYTVPFLYDSTKGRAVADSFLIAQYLDEAYPETPVVIPTGTRILQSIASEAIAAKANIPRLIREQLNKQMTPVFLEELLKSIGCYSSPWSIVARGVERRMG